MPGSPAIARSENDSARVVAGTVFEFCGERESLSLAGFKAEELLLLGFLLGLLLGFRHGNLQ